MNVTYQPKCCGGYHYGWRRRSLHQDLFRRLGGFRGRVGEESCVMSGFELLRSRLWKFLYRDIAVCLTVRGGLYVLFHLRHMEERLGFDVRL